MTDRVAGPLRGAGIVVTRPARQAAGLAHQIAAIGGIPLIFPAIVILPPADTRALEVVRRDLETYDAAVFVSANAVEYGVGDPAQWPARVACFAPGPGTAAALSAVNVVLAELASGRDTFLDNAAVTQTMVQLDANANRFAAAANARIRKHWWRQLSRPLLIGFERLAPRRRQSPPGVARGGETVPGLGDETAPPAAPLASEASVREDDGPPS